MPWCCVLYATSLAAASPECACSGAAGRQTLNFVPLPADDPHRRQPDIALATARLGGWVPRVSLDEGLKQTIPFFDNPAAAPAD